MIVTKCRLCKSKRLFQFLDLGYHPPSDQFRNIKDLNKEVIVYPLKVLSCSSCGFKQLNYVVDPKILYQQNYPYEASITEAGKIHWFNFANSVVRKFTLKRNDLIVDIGSNTGVLLNGFKKKKLKVIGVDPASNICKIARKRGINTINSFFNDKTVLQIKKKFGRAKIITGTNVFAHINNLDKFIINVKNLLTKKGVLIIEVPHFLHLIKKLEYDTIYHEHLSYISVIPLIKFFKKYNLQIIDILQKDIHGGSIRIFISETGNYKISKNVKKICNLEIKLNLNSKKTLNDFAKKVSNNRYELISLLTKLKKAKKKIIALSAPAKGMTLLNYSKIDYDYLDYATEKSKIKKGLYTPGGNLPIFSDSKILQTKPDYALLLAWNFSKEIIKNNKKFLKNGGKFIIPIPSVKIIKKYEKN